ncbi:PAS domain-containing protein [Tundrisphaera lichenicola]|uniref:PAS domain-containing protein n=1 Tax=Tundrisphaera lichenicola TaxID=2029860 RepID=UPI003EB92677
MTAFEQIFRNLFSTDGFVPRRLCGLWPDWLVWEHVAGNASIWLAYMAIPLLIWRLGQRRPDLAPFRESLLAFGLFIGFCGLGHFLDMVSFFRPMYRFSGHILIATGAASWWTAWAIRRAWPTIIAMKSPAELERVIAERTEKLTRVIEDLKRAREDRARLATIVESSDDAIISKDIEGLITSWNAGAQRLLGYTPEEVIGRPVSFLLPPDRQDEESMIQSRLREGGRVKHFETIRRTKSGDLIDVSLTISPISDDSGRLIGFSKIARDITEAKRAEHRLRESESRFRQLADAMPQIVWTADSNGQADYWNERWYDYSGQPRDFGSDDYWTTFLHPDDRDRCLETWYRAVRSGEPYQIEYRFRERNSGDYRWQLGRALPVKDEAGRVVRWIGTLTDIEDQKRVEHALRTSEERQRLALSAARIAHWEWDIVEDSIPYQDSIALLYGRLDDRPFEDFSEYLTIVHPDDRELVREAAERAMAPGVPYEVEYRVIWPDGSTHWLSGRGATYFDGQGRPVRMLGVNLDITELKDSEVQIRLLNESLEHRVQERTADLALANQAIRESEASLREAQRLAEVGSWEWDAIEDRTTWSDELFRIAGLDPARDAPRLIDHDQLYTPESLRLLRSMVDRALETGEPYQLELEMTRPDGVHRWIIAQGEVVRDEGGRVVRIRGTAQDVTERREQREELRRARDEAMAATLAKGNFLANMSHEIRTPMNGVIGLADLLLDTDLNPIQRSYAASIHASGEALLAIINDILDLSKIEAGKMTLDLVPCDLRSIFEEIASLLRPRALQKGLALIAAVDPAIPARVMGDPTRIRQVLTNLGGNALKFTDSGRVEMRAELLEIRPKDARIRISVRDTGIGISLEDQVGIFDSFTQVQGDPSRKLGGTGLGLSIVRQLAELMGGQVGVESLPNRGSTFWVEIRLDVGAPAELLPHGPANILKVDRLEVPIRILLAEDQEINRLVASRMIERLGGSVDVVCNGREAIEAMEGSSYDLIILDIQMPVMGGLDAATEIRRRETTGGRRVPIIALTANAMQEDRRRCLESGMDDYLTKPIRPQALQETIRRWGPSH